MYIKEVWWSSGYRVSASRPPVPGSNLGGASPQCGLRGDRLHCNYVLSPYRPRWAVSLKKHVCLHVSGPETRYSVRVQLILCSICLVASVLTVVLEGKG